MRTYILAASITLLLASCQESGTLPAASENEPLSVSMYQLIVMPERFDGKRVRVDGYLHLEFEGNGLYAHKEDYDRFLSKNGVWIDVQSCGSGRSAGINDHYVVVEATFNSEELGHLGLWSGTLSNVTRCDILPDFRSIRAEPEGASNNSFKPTPLRGAA